MPDISLRFRAGGRSQTINIPVSSSSTVGAYAAERPREVYEPPYVPRTGTVRTVNSGGDVQAALDAANPGDVVVLESGAVFSGTFVLPTNKSGGVGGDIYVVSSAIHNNTFDTPIGTRKTTDAGCVTLRHPGSGAVPLLSTSGNGRTGWRFVGIRFDVPSGYTGTDITRLIQLGDPSVTTVAGYPGRFAFDRCRFFGRPLAQVRRAIWVTGPYFYLGDSVIEDICSVDVGDSQGVLITSAAGKCLVNNTAIGGPTESVMVGGLDSNVIPDTSVIPADVEFRNGHHYCMPYQDPTNAAWNGVTYNTKTLGECKGGHRITWRNMVLQRHLGTDQQSALVPKGGGQAGQAIAAASDIVIENIKLVDCMAFLTVRGFSAVGGPNAITRVVARNIALYGAKDTSTITPRLISVTDWADRVECDRITAILTGGNSGISYIESGADQLSNIRVTNSILGATYGMQIAGDLDAGMSSLVTGDRIITNNLLVGRPDRYEASNRRPANAAAVGFTSYANSPSDNLQLGTGTTYKGSNPGGTDPGCDIPALLAATAGCVSGVWP